MSLDNPFVALEPAIIVACANHENDNRKVLGYRRLIHFADYIIKFGDSKVFSSEVQTHDHIDKVTEKDLTAPRGARSQRAERHTSRACLATHPKDGIGHLLDEDIFLNRNYL